MRVTGVGCCSLLALADLCVRSTPPGGWGLLLYRVEGLFLRPFIRRVRVIIRVSVSFPYTWVPYFYSACFSSLCAFPLWIRSPSPIPAGSLTCIGLPGVMWCLHCIGVVLYTVGSLSYTCGLLMMCEYIVDRVIAGLSGVWDLFPGSFICQGESLLQSIWASPSVGSSPIFVLSSLLSYLPLQECGFYS